MPTMQEIADSIADRLGEARQQISSLEAARSALTATARSASNGPSGAG
jgi:hypothetical protein